MKVNVIIPAAGSGRRMKKEGAKQPKQFMLLDGIPMVYHSLKVFSALPEVTRIIVATQPSQFKHFDKAVLRRHGISKVRVVAGGKERVDSVRNGLVAAERAADLIAVHDAARPYIAKTDVLRVIRTAEKKGAAILARSVVPTVKQVRRSGKIVQTIDRTTLKHAETPQVFKARILKEAHTAYVKGEITGPATDDAFLVEGVGQDVWCVEAKKPNMKITHMSDLL